MFLNDRQINDSFNKGLSIENLTDLAVGPASVDLHLRGEFLVTRPSKMVKTLKDFKKPDTYHKIAQDYIVLEPGDFCLAGTKEIVHMRSWVESGHSSYENNSNSYSYAGIIKSRSSLARAGIILPNAGWVDPGFEGSLTLQLYNAGNSVVQLEAGDKVVQLVLIRVQTPSILYSGGYNNEGETLGVREEAF